MNKTAWILCVLMCLAAVGGIAARPGTKAGERGPSISLETMVPRQFGSWKELPNQQVAVVNPQTKELLDKIYSQTLTRTYVDSKGYRIMLSLAYGDDQRGALQAHKPEVCYPAQGFKLHSNEVAKLRTDFGPIDGRRLNTSLGARKEPITYWFTMGERTVGSQMERRVNELRLALTGQVPDGLLFRVSSIDDNPARAFSAQQVFINDLMRAVPPDDRVRLGGISLRDTPKS